MAGAVHYCLHRSRVARLVGACAIVVACATVPARAQPAPGGPRIAATTPAHALAWRAPAGCPDAASVRARVERRLERSLEDVVAGVDVEVSLAAGRYLARIDLGALTVANDVRTLTSKRCSELADAVALIVARVAGESQASRRMAGERHVADEPSATSRVANEPSATSRVAALDREDPTLIAPVAVAAAAAEVEVPAAPRRWTVGVRLSGVSGIGVIPQVGLGGELALTLRRDSHLAELAGTRWATSAAQLYTGAPAPLDIDLDVAVARVGWRPYQMPLRGWFGVEVGSIRGSGVELPSQQLDGGRWLAAGAGFGIAWQMKPWLRLVGTTEVMVAIERVRFSNGDGIVAYAPSPMSVRTTCGLEVGWQ